MDLGPIEIPITEVTIENLEISGGLKGEKGEQGEPGVQGPPGPIGPSGSSDWGDLENVPDGVAALASGTLSMNYVEGLEGELSSKQNTLAGTSDVPGLDTALSAKQDTLTGVADVPGLTSALNLKADGADLADYQPLNQKSQPNGYASLDSSGKVPSTQLPEAQALEWGAIEGSLSDQADLTNALNSKQSTLTGTSDVPGLDTALGNKADSSQLAGYQSIAEKGAANGYASLGSDGKVPSSQLPAEATTSWGDIEGTLAAQTDLSSALASKQDILLSTGDVPGLDTALSNKADTSALANYQATSERGQANGYATLGADGKVPLAQLPASALEITGDKGDLLVIDTSEELANLPIGPDGSSVLSALGGEPYWSQVDPDGWFAPDSIWGDGSDGPVAITYTQTLNADVQATTLTVDAGAVLRIGATEGRPIYLCATEEIVINGEISASATNISTGTGSGSENNLGGRGGQGGANGEGSPGSLPDYDPAPRGFDSLTEIALGLIAGEPVVGGTVGGKGAAGAFSGIAGGDGGGGGGVVILRAPRIHGSGVVSAIGHEGAHKFASDGGAGGGGGGGVVLAVCRRWNGPSCQVVGGGAGISFHPGSSGEAGADGSIHVASELTEGLPYGATHYPILPRWANFAQVGEGAAEWGQISGTLGDQADLAGALASKANASHEHSATDITSGTLPVARGGTGGTNQATAQSALGVPPSTRSISTTAPLTGGGTLAANRTISIPQATASVDGYLAAADFAAFASKADGSLAGRVTTAEGNIGDLESDVLALQTGKSDTSHTHTLASLTDVLISNPENGQSLLWDSDNSRFVNGTAGGGGGGYSPPIPQSDVSGLVSDLAGKAPVSHTHASTDITSGQLAELLNLFSSLNPGETITVNEEGSLVAIVPTTGSSGEGMVIQDNLDFGTGADGAVTATSGTLTADVNATTYTVPSGVTVKIGWNVAAGRPAVIKATTSITVQGGGVLTADGSDGEDATSYIGGNGGASPSGGGGGGGGGITTSGTGGASPLHPGNDGSRGGGDGGAGGAHSFSVGGRGGFSSSAVDLPGDGGGGGLTLRYFPMSVSDLIEQLCGAGGGGGGVGPATSNAGGGGGGGGGGIGLYAPIVSILGLVSARGGNGGNQNGSAGSSGGGGGGGQIQIVCRQLSILSWAAIQVAGGDSPRTLSSYSTVGARGQDGALLLACEDMPSFSGIDRAQILYIPVAPTE